MSLFGLGTGTSIWVMTNLQRTEAGRDWFGDVEMRTSESHQVEFQGAPMLACEGRRVMAEGNGCL